MSDNPQQNPGTVPGPEGQNQGNQGQGQTPPAKTFTQAELDAHIAERLKREREKYADYDTLKTRAAKLQEIEDAQKSAEQKLQEQLTTLQQQTEKAQADRRAAVLRSAIVAAAAKADMTDPADAYSLLDLSKIELKDDDTATGVDEAIKALIETKPYLVKTAPGRQAPTPTSPTNPAGNKGADNLDWHPLRRKHGAQLGGGGVRYNEEA